MRVEREKYKVGEYLYSMDWGLKGDGTEVKKTKILKVSKLLITIENEWGPRRVKRFSLMIGRYHTSEAECLAAAFKENGKLMSGYKTRIKSCGDRNMKIIKRMAKLKSKVK